MLFPMPIMIYEVLRHCSEGTVIISFPPRCCVSFLERSCHRRSIMCCGVVQGAAVAKFGVDVQGDDECPNAPFDQCGGTGWTGPTCCSPGYNCTYDNEWYSGCNLEDLCLTVQYGQCAGTVSESRDGQKYGKGQKKEELASYLACVRLVILVSVCVCFFFPSGGVPLDKEYQCCPPSFECEYVNQYYSQCVEAGTNSTDCAPAYGQCGGEGWTGKTNCCPGYSCEVDNEYFSGCQPIPVCENAAYGQCGGVDSDGQPWTVDHMTCCPDGERARDSATAYDNHRSFTPIQTLTHLPHACIFRRLQVRVQQPVLLPVLPQPRRLQLSCFLSPYRETGLLPSPSR